jgi:UDP-N-acetylmuramate--alanine ligase
LDDDGVLELLPYINKKKVTYGLSPQCDIRAVDIEFHGLSSSCTVVSREQELGRLSIDIPGIHNLRNALGAVTASLQLDVPFQTIAEALKEFTGVYRRFERKGIRKGVTVVDDYAHHPTEVQSTLQATRNGWKGRIIAVFQPHTFTRTRDFYKDFAKSFFNADELVLTDIYPAREKPIEGVDGEMIARAATEYGHKSVHYVENKRRIPELLTSIAQEGDIVLTIGAGDIWKYGEEFLKL